MTAVVSAAAVAATGGAADGPGADEVGDAPVLRRWLAGLALVVTAVALVGVPLRADDVSRTTADEPQYLLSALSLWEDGDLDIADELEARAYEPFHEVALPEQTRPLDDGRRVSPHDPLLPVVLAVPVGVAGWVGAKVALALLAGALAAATAWVAARRFGVRVPVAVGVVGALAVVPPLATYGTQVYPELPAALVVVLVVAAVTAPRLRAVHVAAAAAGLVALPWLAVKYAPVVVALAAVLAWRLGRDRRWTALVGLGAVGAVGAVTFLAAHQVLYDGWTAYAAGDHFVDGELTVVGHDPAYAGRTVRLAGLLLDARFGLAAWAPAWLLAVPALAALARRRPVGWVALAAPLAAGWANATWVALTMSGWWWPGRQVVVVLPLAVVALAWWVDRLLPAPDGSPRPAGRPTVGRSVVVALGVATAWGVATWAWLATEVLVRQRDLIIDFYATSGPTYRLWAAVLPDVQAPSTGDRVLLVAWVGALVAAAALGWRSVAPDGGSPAGTTAGTTAGPTPGGHEDDGSAPMPPDGEAGVPHGRSGEARVTIVAGGREEQR